MKYVKFSGATPLPNTTYEEYLAFDDEEARIDMLNKYSTSLAIENAERYTPARLTDDDFLSSCCENAHWTFVTKTEFWNFLEK